MIEYDVFKTSSSGGEANHFHTCAVGKEVITHGQLNKEVVEYASWAIRCRDRKRRSIYFFPSEKIPDFLSRTQVLLFSFVCGYCKGNKKG